ncbi:MAG: hypothetical protein ACK40G_06290 [Cytophagaceae bacterium]
MGKRLVRIKGNEISGRLKELSGKTVTVILNNKNPFVGIIDSHENDILKFSDMRGTVHSVLKSHITEIIIDITAAR